MRTLVHVSDLHFGRLDDALIEPLIAAAHGAQPDLVVISGDLTQRARIWQFRAARAFLQRLPGPQMVVPGNHDVPLDHVVARALWPFRRFRQYISDDLDPAFVDDEIAVLALNTARALTVAGGWLVKRQLAQACERLCSLPADVVKVIVTHHPFDLPVAVASKYLMRDAANALGQLVRCGADLFLAGHIHVRHTELTTRRYLVPGAAALIVQAGTCLSTRRRGEGNSFNVVRVNGGRIEAETMAWAPGLGMFVSAHCERFERKQEGWMRAA